MRFNADFFAKESIVASNRGHGINALLVQAMSELSDAELYAFEDELNFFVISGLVGPRMKELMRFVSVPADVDRPFDEERRAERSELRLVA